MTEYGAAQSPTPPPVATADRMRWGGKGCEE
jgi:hypothetical protein